MNEKVLESKKQVVSELVDNFKNAHSMVVVEYRGLTVAELGGLKKSLKGANAKMNVYKNTLVKRAVDELKIDGFDSYLTGSNAYVFSSDVSAAPSVLAKFAKKNDKLVIKAGIVEGRVMDANGIKAVAQIPGREQLLSMFLSCLQAPIRKFACSVKAVADKQA